MNVSLSMNNRRPLGARECEEPLPAWTSASTGGRQLDPISPAAETPQDKSAGAPAATPPSARADH